MSGLPIELVGKIIQYVAEFRAMDKEMDRLLKRVRFEAKMRMVSFRCFYQLQRKESINEAFKRISNLRYGLLNLPFKRFEFTEWKYLYTLCVYTAALEANRLFLLKIKIN